MKVLLIKAPYLEVYKGLKATMISSRGCPSQCTFCAIHLTMGRKHRIRSVESVVDEMLIESLHTAWKRFYLRPGYFICQLFRMRSIAELYYYLQDGLNMFREYLLTRVKPSINIL